MQNTTQATPTADCLSLPSQPSTGFQHNWSRVPGQPSMADIVRLGRPQSKPSSTPLVATEMSQSSDDPIVSNMTHQSSKQPPATIAPSESAQEHKTSQGPIPQDEERSRELGSGMGHYNSHDDWSVAGHTSAGSESTHPEISGTAFYADPSVSSSLLADEANIEVDPHLDENQVHVYDVNDEYLPTESTGSASISDEQEEADDSGDHNRLGHNLLNGMYHSQMHTLEHHEGIFSD